MSLPHSPSDIDLDGELFIIEHVIKDGQIVFDIGAHSGEWSDRVFAAHPHCTIHAFEPIPEYFNQLLKKFPHQIGSGQFIANNLAISNTPKIQGFYYYFANPMLSTFHRRVSAEQNFGIEIPQKINVFATQLDQYCQERNISRIDFLKIDVEGAELEVIAGASQLLKQGKIDFLQFEYGGTFQDSGTTLAELYRQLKGYHYYIFKIHLNTLELIEEFTPGLEDYQYSNFLAVNERLISSFLGKPPKMLNLSHLFELYKIQPKGIIQIGAHEGQELEHYAPMNLERLLLIEANPSVFQRLNQRIQDKSHIIASNIAISNYNGETTLYVTSFDQSSSTMPLKDHQKLYPSIHVVDEIKVPCRTVDQLLMELELDPTQFNVLNIDIQGAELLALQGSLQLLPYIDAINTEVNYSELYEGCASIDQLDQFLNQHGFIRVATTSPYHPSWGDAFYVRKPVITMSSLGQNGRFGNQLFQYAFLKLYAQEHDFRLELPNWIGRHLFDLSDPLPIRNHPIWMDPSNEISHSKTLNSETPQKNIDLWGYFQFHTGYYRKFRQQFIGFFQPQGVAKQACEQALNTLRSLGKTIVGLHLRRGDFGYGQFFIAPSKWYLHWLEGFWDTLKDPVLFIASDEPEKVIADFQKYKPITSRNLGVSLGDADFYIDFYLLTQCDAAAISNSSFSFAACMLNTQATIFVRPHYQSEKLIPFDPWDAKPIFEDVVHPPMVTDSSPPSQPYQVNPEWTSILNDYLSDPCNQVYRERVFQLRRDLTETWLSIPVQQLEDSWSGSLGAFHIQILNSGMIEEPLDERDLFLFQELHKKMESQKNAGQYLIAISLFRHAFQVNLNLDLIDSIPFFLLDFLIQFLLFPVSIFADEQRELYFERLRRLVNNFSAREKAPLCDLDRWRKILEIFVKANDFTPLYFTDHCLKSINVNRSRVIESYFDAFQLMPKSLTKSQNYTDSAVNLARPKLRLAILSRSFLPYTEAFTTLPMYKHLDGEIFEVILISEDSGFSDPGNLGRFRRYCASFCDYFMVLPKTLEESLEVVQSLGLDIILAASNITAKSDLFSLLCFHRLARVQIANNSSPATTGFPNIDYFISGLMTETSGNPQDQYSETLVLMPGSAHCFDYSYYLDKKPLQSASKSTLGIHPEQVVFVSGAQAYKISTRLLQCWARVLAAIANSILVLYPYSPSWVGSYGHLFKRRFVAALNQVFKEFGLEISRVIILDQIPDRLMVLEHLKVMDVYLESFPFSGCNSTVDPLEVGLPVVALKGNSFRSSQAGALLTELGIPEWVCQDEEEYIQKAIQLGTDPTLRQQVKNTILDKMKAPPRFLDPYRYGQEIQKVYLNLYGTYLVEELKKFCGLPSDRALSIWVIAPNWAEDIESLYLELLKIISSFSQDLPGSILWVLRNSDLGEVDPDELMASIALELMALDESINFNSDECASPEVYLLPFIHANKLQLLQPHLAGAVHFSLEDPRQMESLSQLPSYQG